MTPSRLLVNYLVFLTSLVGLHPCSVAQLIRLRNPESRITATNLFFNPARLPPQNPNPNVDHNQRRPNPVPVDGKFTNERPPNSLLLASQEAARRRRPKSGNVLVHYDSKHDIDRVQYVLQDGHLATVYSRRDETKADSAAQPIVQQQQQQQEQEKGPTNQMLLEAHRFDGKQTEQAETKTGVIETHEKTPTNWETPQVLTTFAHDPMAPQKDLNLNVGFTGNEKATKLGKFLGKLKKKIDSKLLLFPKAIQLSLNAKSSNGKLFVDREGGERIPIELQGEHHQHLINNPFDRLQMAETKHGQVIIN